MNEKIPGFATPEGTQAYRTRFVGEGASPGHFREKQGICFSSVGAGTYLGDSDEATDALYEESIAQAIQGGVNVIDSAVNYRSQRSERTIGRVLKRLIGEGSLKREEIILCTKGGFLPFDEVYPADPGAYFQKTFVEPGILEAGDIVQGCHAMTPRYLENQLEQSLDNFGVETIDVYYVHNPECQLAEIGRREFLDRLLKVFKFMEEKVREGKIRMYGTATWTGYRGGEDQQDYLSLQEIDLLAREAGGPEHHFRVIQLPFNMAMPEAWVVPNQRFGPGQLSLLNAAERMGLIVMASASLLQAKMIDHFPPNLLEKFKGVQGPAQCALQFARSVPGITTALVGMKTPGHVDENLAVSGVPPLTEQDLVLMFQ